jgi:hypothetical protein
MSFFGAAEAPESRKAATGHILTMRSVIKSPQIGQFLIVGSAVLSPASIKLKLKNVYKQHVDILFVKRR